MITYCMVCDDETECRHLPLYVNGSEGLYICHGCEMELVEHIRQVQYKRGKARIAQVLGRKARDEDIEIDVVAKTPPVNHYPVKVRITDVRKGDPRPMREEE